MVNFGDFFENLKIAVKQCYQTGQFELDKIQNFKWDILSNIQTMYSGYKSHKSLIFIHFVRFGVKVNFSQDGQMSSDGIQRLDVECNRSV